MHSSSVCKLIPSTILGFRIVPESRIAGNMLNIIGGCLSPAFRKFISLEKPCMNVFPGFRIPEGSSLRTIKIHLVVNVSYIRPHKPSCIPQQSTPEPPPIKIEGEFEYEVEQILNSQLCRGNLHYLVKWLGYTKEHNTWEPLSNLTNANEAVKEFHKWHPSALCHIQTLSLFQFHPIVNHTDILNGVTSKLNLEERPFHEMRILKRE